MQLINKRLISHPINWLTIILMLIIAGIFGHLVLSWFGMEPSNGNTPTSPYSSPQNTQT